MDKTRGQSFYCLPIRGVFSATSLIIDFLDQNIAVIRSKAHQFVPISWHGFDSPTQN